MTNLPIPGASGPGGVQPSRGVDGAGSPAGKANAKDPSADSPAFHVLLEKLQAQALELEQKSQALEAPEHLAEAVDIARASLDDALSLSDQLLESFRGANLKGTESETPENQSEEKRS